MSVETFQWFTERKSDLLLADPPTEADHWMLCTISALTSGHASFNHVVAIGFAAAIARMATARVVAALRPANSRNGSEHEDLRG